MRKRDVFLPPGVQARLYQRLGRIPQRVTNTKALKIEKLWRKRNYCPEEQIEAIDQRMERIMIAPELPRCISVRLNLHGRGTKTHHVYVLRCRNKADYWANVTDIRCPVCQKGMIRWHEAGYVPGYRKCDGCGREYLAKGTTELPTLCLI